MIVAAIVIVIFFHQPQHAVYVNDAQLAAVPVKRKRVVFPIEGGETEFHCVCEAVLAVDADHDQIVRSAVGRREDGVPVNGQ